MHIFKFFFKVLKKNIIIPILYILVSLAALVTISQPDSGSKFERRNFCIGYVDEDDTSESRALIDLIAKNNQTEKVENDRERILDDLYYCYYDYVLVIKKGYAEKLMSGETNGLFSTYHMHDSYTAVYIEQLLNEYVCSVKAGIAGGIEFSENIKNVEKAMSESAEVQITNPENTQKKSDVFCTFFSFCPYVLLSTVMYALCPILLAMTRNGIRSRTNCSCVSPSSFNIQLFSGTTVCVIGIWLIIMLSSIVIFGKIYSGTEWFAVLNTLIYVLFSASFAVFVSAFDIGKNMLNLVVQVFGLGSSFLCGVFVPQYLIDSNVLAVAKFFPAYWYVRANLMICGEEALNYSELYTALLIELGFAAAFAVLGLLVRRLRFNSSSTVAA